MIAKLFLLASLYVAQFIPTTFVIQAVPVFMRQQKMSLEAIGLLGFLVVPSATKFLWSPFIDRYRIPGLGQYRGWIICFQSLLISTIVGVAFLDIQTNFTALFVCMFLIFLFSSSQDIATDALAVNLLQPHERGLGNAIQASGNFLGAIIGGGITLILFERIGWQGSLITIAIALFLCLIPTLLYQESPKPVDTRPLFKAYFQPFIRFFSRPKTWLWLVFILLYVVSENVSTTLIRPLLVDRGLSLSQIGQLLGIVSYSARIVAALIAGVLVTKWGRKRSLIIFGIISNLASLLYILPAMGVSNLPTLYGICVLVSGFQSMAYTALLTALMDRSNPSTAGTDYTTQISAAFLSVVATSILGGRFAEANGYISTLLISTIISLLSIVLINKAYLQIRDS